MTKAQQREKETQRQEAVDYLRSILKSGDIVYTVLTHVSQSGMSRRIKLFIPSTRTWDGEEKPVIQNITWQVCKALDYKQSNSDDALVVGGCGMDMGFHLVYSLGRVLFPKTDNEDSGYKLRHEWL